MPITVVRRNITKIKADAIVSASGHDLASHGAVSFAIFAAAGPGLQEECDKAGTLDTGSVLVTGAYDLPADFVIHTVGPEWKDGHSGEGLLLSACYQNCLKAAWERGCRSIAFPLISSGGYRFPKEHALKTAMDAIAEFEHFGDMDVTLAVYDRNSYEVSRDLLRDIAEYIGDDFEKERFLNYSDRMLGMKFPGRRERREKEEFLSRSECREEEEFLNRCERREKEEFLSRSECMEEEEDSSIRSKDAPSGRKRPGPAEFCRLAEAGASVAASQVPQGVIDAIRYRDESFREMLIRLMIEKDLQNTDVYKRANVSRAVFSNILSKPSYRAKKGTALALALALKLDLEETRQLLAKAGHALSGAFKQDRVVEYFIVHGIFDVFYINEVLFALDLPRLGEKTE